MRRLVLVIDDDALESRYISAVMAADGLSVLQTARLVEGLVWIERFEPAVVMVSEDTEGYEARDVMSIVRRMTSAPLIVIGEGEVRDELSSLEAGADFYLRRPFGSAELLLRVRRLLRASEQGGRHGGQPEAFVGAGGAMVKVVRNRGHTHKTGGGSRSEGIAKDRLAS